MNTQVLEARVRALGPEHRDTLLAKNNLAEDLRNLGDYAAARELDSQALEAPERTLGLRVFTMPTR
ncbi:MAG: tetratricopeptide repeat protein [Deltaproteobacteria bacterium]|nr:tetratricopeptide repeat protein [Deltaproteobacteria bacterium]